MASSGDSTPSPLLSKINEIRAIIWAFLQKLLSIWRMLEGLHKLLGYIGVSTTGLTVALATYWKSTDTPVSWSARWQLLGLLSVFFLVGCLLICSRLKELKILRLERLVPNAGKRLDPGLSRILWVAYGAGMNGVIVPYYVRHSGANQSSVCQWLEELAAIDFLVPAGDCYSIRPRGTAYLTAYRLLESPPPKLGKAN